MNQWRPRQEPERWPSATPMWLIGTQLLALIVAIMIQYYCYERIWTPLQRFYFSAYIRSQILICFGISAGTYQVLNIKEAKRTRSAVDADVTTARGSDPSVRPCCRS